MARSSSAAAAPPRADGLALVYVCVALSGAAGLVLEIVWSKYLSLLLGNSIHGASTVVAAFLGGLGLGALAGGALAGRVRDALGTYARLEIVVGAAALGSPLAYAAARPAFAFLYQLLGEGGPAFHAVRFAAAFGALLGPTLAMGATLPLLASELVRRGEGLGSAVGRLYAINTLGAAAGAAAAGFLLVPALGLARSALLAGLLDLGVAAALLAPRRALGRRGAPVATTRAQQPVPAARRAGTGGPCAPPGGRSLVSRLVVPLFAVSGFTAIVYEIAWTRLLSVPFGGMVYALSAILALYLLGIGLGSAAGARMLRRRAPRVLLFGLLEIALGATVAAGTAVLDLVPRLQTSLLGWTGTSPARLFAGEAGIAALLVLVPTLLLGALFPTAAAVHHLRQPAAGPATGTVYLANTAGSVAGALAAGFLLLPLLGVTGSLLLGSGANVSIGLLAVGGSELRSRTRWALAGAGAVGLALAVLPGPSRGEAERQTFGLTRLLRAHRSGHAEDLRKQLAEGGAAHGGESVLFHREGSLASVVVVEEGEVRTLLLNGKPDASAGRGADMLTQVLLGHLPLLLAPDAKDVCIVGYGSGVTAHAALTHPVREVLTVELEPAVIEAAPFFRASAFAPLDDPRGRLVIEDAGTFLRATARRFDVIVSEPSNPWIAGIGNLFTREFYEDAAARLAPGGLFCQWVQGYEIAPETVATVFRTLAGTFHSGQVFFVGPSRDVIVVASVEGPLAIDPRGIGDLFASGAVGGDLGRVGIASAADLLRYYVTVRSSHVFPRGWVGHAFPRPSTGEGGSDGEEGGCGSGGGGAQVLAGG